MVEGFQLWAGGDAKTLAVVLHGWRGSPARMKDVTDATRDAFAAQGGADIYAPTLPHARALSSVRAATVLLTLLSNIDQIVADHPRYERIILIGHSLGAVLVRRLFLIAAGSPPGFQCEQAFSQSGSRSWAALVDRIVTLGAFNRGWQVSARMGWFYSIWLNLVGLIGHLSPNDWQPTIFDIRVGAPFIVQTRLNWLAYRRLHQRLRSGKAEAEARALPAARTRDPIVVQLIGTKDNLASPFDQVDIAVDGQHQTASPQDQRYFFIELSETDHERSKDFPNTPVGRKRRELFKRALTDQPEQLPEISGDPALLADDPLQVDPNVTDTIFIMHGIRDDGFWTHRIAKKVRENATKSIAIRARTPTYGYFAMLPFVLPWIRRQKVEWFMDQYVSAVAQFPDSKISYVGHSNGTYLAARGLRDYPAAKLKHVFFAGSVVARDYDWRSLVSTGRVEKIHNVRASEDSVVALLPKSIEHWKKFDLGGAGFDGFDQAGTDKNITQPARFAKGGHSAAIAEGQWPYIAQFILDGTRPPELPEDDFVAAPSPRLVRLADMHIGLPVLVLVFLLIIPILIAWPLWPGFSGHGLEWPRSDLTLRCAVADTLALVGYILLLKFVVTRV